MKRLFVTGAAATLAAVTPLAASAQTPGVTADPVVNQDAGDDDDFPIGLLGLLGLAGLLGLKRRDTHSNTQTRP